MKVKLDENLPRQIAVELRARAHDVETVGEEGLTGRADADVWQATQREGRLLITQDLDFSEVSAGHASRNCAHTSAVTQPAAFDRSGNRTV